MTVVWLCDLNYGTGCREEDVISWRNALWKSVQHLDSVLGFLSKSSGIAHIYLWIRRWVSRAIDVLRDAVVIRSW